MNRTISIILLCMYTFTASNMFSQNVKTEILKQKNINKMGVKTGNYSGITHINDNLYAIVSDKEKTDGFYIFEINIDRNNGSIESVVRNDSIFGSINPQTTAVNGISTRDCEGIAYIKSSNTFFIAGEGDQRIKEYSYTGVPTGRELKVPEIFNIKNIQPNYGFEALTYDKKRKLLWTCTESALKKDISAEDNVQGMIIRMQSFDETLQAQKQYAYRTERPEKNKTSNLYAFGVPEMVALDNGEIIVMEREFYVTKSRIGSHVNIKLFLVNPSECESINDSSDVRNLSDKQILKKTLLASFKTKLNLTARSIANYEGMCLGPKLKDGRQTLLLINDSQAGFGNSLFKLKDYIKVLIFETIHD